MKLNLTRPLAFFDLEATGIDRENDRIVEIAICKLMPDGSQVVKTRRVNPGIPILAGATEVHGISDDDVKDEPFFEALAPGLIKFLEDCDVAGFNSNAYDIPMLFNEFQRAGIYWDYTKFRKIDAGNIFKINEPRTLSAAVKFYCGRDMENAHSAEADILATVDVFMAQVEKYPDLPANLDELELFCNYGKPILDISGKFTTDDEGFIVFNYGPKRGVRAMDELGLVQWMINKDFPQDTKNICYQILEEYE
jgi:DNA polymerase-3 subunit epsilon